MSQLIDPSPAISVLQHQGWSVENDLKYLGCRIVKMLPPEPESPELDLLFIGRDKNQSRNYKYGIPVDLLGQVHFVVLWALHERNMFLIPWNDLYEILGDTGSLAKIDDMERWHVNVYFDWVEKWEGTALVPQGAANHGRNLDEFLIESPQGTVGAWYRATVTQ